MWVEEEISEAQGWDELSRLEAADVNASASGLTTLQTGERVSAEEALLLEQLHLGAAGAGDRFVRNYYPGIFRYLLSLTGRREVAEDLTQETFLRAWRHLHGFEPRAPLRHWLYRIAHREFLRSLERRREQASLEEVAEPAAPSADPWAETAELHAAISRLPLEEREAVLLHYLEGYSSAEIAAIVRAPAGTVRSRLSQARERLRQHLGEGDLPYLNEPTVPMRQWAWLPLDQIYALEARLTMGGTGDRETSKEKPMERREFLRHAVVGTAGLMLPEAEKEVVDSRLTQKVTCAFKGTALSDLCERLRSETKVHLVAGNSVADEKVTLFCEKLPLREVMRQLSRPFGYTWVRSGLPSPPGGGSGGGLGYRYELMQDLRSQLLEEELRNRDRNEALLALEKEIERYRPYLDLSPDEALERVEAAPPAERKLLEKLAGFHWGPIQIYFRLSPRDQAALRAGEELTFSQEPNHGERRLPADVARGVLQSFRDWRVVRREDGHLVFGPMDLVGRDGVPASQSSEARAAVSVTLEQSELGSMTLGGLSVCFGAGHSPFWHSQMGGPPFAVGQSPGVMKPENGRVNRRLSADPRFSAPVTVRPEPSCRPSPEDNSAGGSPSEPKVTTADVLEALHRATGRPIVADSYTRLYPAPEVTVRNLRLFETLNQISDTMHLRWNKDEEWLQFRSTSFYHDRIKEVPNRLLSRWSASRRRHAALTLDDLIEIAQLSEAQLDSAAMAEGARHCWGLREWDLGSNPGHRVHLRYLAGFTPEQRQAAMSGTGLVFTRMSLAQQQGFLSLATLPDAEPLQSLVEFEGAVLRVDYSLPGWFQWGDPGMYHSWPGWVVPVEPGPQGRRVLRPIIRERTREAVLQALSRLNPEVRDAAVQTVRQTLNAAGEAASRVPLEAQVYPTVLRLTFIYVPGSSNARRIRITSGTMTNYQLTW
jgi:RNA polymerase sigma factor (sigma-70 family)